MGPPPLNGRAPPVTPGILGIGSPAPLAAPTMPGKIPAAAAPPGPSSPGGASCVAAKPARPLAPAAPASGTSIGDFLIAFVVPNLRILGDLASFTGPHMGAVSSLAGPAAPASLAAPSASLAGPQTGFVSSLTAPRPPAPASVASPRPPAPATPASPRAPAPASPASPRAPAPPTLAAAMPPAAERAAPFAPPPPSFTNFLAAFLLFVMGSKGGIGTGAMALFASRRLDLWLFCRRFGKLTTLNGVARARVRGRARKLWGRQYRNLAGLKLCVNLLPGLCKKLVPGCEKSSGQLQPAQAGHATWCLTKKSLFYAKRCTFTLLGRTLFLKRTISPSRCSLLLPVRMAETSAEVV